MLAWHELDAVLVATPIPLHYEHVVKGGEKTYQRGGAKPYH